MTKFEVGTQPAHLCLFHENRKKPGGGLKGLKNCEVLNVWDNGVISNGLKHGGVALWKMWRLLSCGKFVIDRIIKYN